MSVDLGAISARLTLNINEFSSNLRRAEEEIENTEKKFSGFDDIGDRFENLGQKLTLGVTAPIVGIGTVASKIGMDFESQMSRVRAISQSTREEFENLEEQALDLGQSTAFSAKEVAEAQENMASAGFKVNEILASTSGILDLAASSGENLGTASAIAAGAIRGFGLEAREAGHVADVLAKAAADTNANVQTMGDAFKYVSPVARGVGWSLESVSAAIGKMADASIDGSTAGTTLRGAITRLANPSKEAAGTMKELGFNAFDSNGKMKSLSTIVDELSKSTKNLTDQQKQQAIAEIFGQEAMSGMTVLMQSGKSELDRLTTSFQNSTGAAKEMATTMQDNAKSSVEQMMGSLETAAIKIEKVIAPTITKVADSVGKVADKFSALNPETQESIIKMGLLAASAGPIVLIFGKLFSSITSIAGGLKMASALFGTTQIATTAVGTAAATATPAVAGIGTAFSGALVPLLPWVAGAGAVALGGYAIHKALTQEAIPAVDLFASKIDTTATTVENSAGGIEQAYTQTTTKISEETKKAVGAYMELDRSASESLTNLYSSTTTITNENSKALIDTYNQMNTQIKQGFSQHYQERISSLHTFFAESTAISAAEEAEILNKEKWNNEERKASQEEFQRKILEILRRASQDKRTLTAEEMQEIQMYQNNMRQNAVEALSKQEVETKIIMERLKSYSGRITAEQASTVIKNAEKQRQEAVAKAESQYHDTVAQIIRMRDETHSITKDQADKLIQEAERQRTQSINKAELLKQGVVNKITSMNSSITSSVNTSTGNILTTWDRLKRWWDNWRPSIKNFVYKITGSEELGEAASNSIGSNWTGTNNWRGGLTTLHEKGYEVYDLPKGTTVYNHEASQDIVIKTAESVATKVANSLLGNISAGNNQPIYITVVSQIDGEVVAKTTAKYDDKIQGNNLRLAGRGLV
ncbi:MAG: phage tail tape measure protein [Clostridium lundense]|nr:phage tail tape measure protein [Clostridium lundense]